MQDLYIPTLHTFENGNIFTGSYNGLRFIITPNIDQPKGAKEIVRENSDMKAECWHGLLCYEKSEMEDEKVFALTEEAREEMRQWLLQHV